MIIAFDMQSGSFIISFHISYFVYLTKREGYPSAHVLISGGPPIKENAKIAIKFLKLFIIAFDLTFIPFFSSFCM